MPSKHPANHVNRGECAAILGIEPPTLDAWVRKGCPFVQKGAKGRAWVFDPAAVLAWRDDWKAKSAKGGGGVTDLNDARQRKVDVERRLAELDLAEREGSLIPIKDVAELVEAEYTNVRSRLTALPGELATELEHLSPAEIQDALAEAIEDVLGELSADTKYGTKTKPGKRARGRPRKVPQTTSTA